MSLVAALAVSLFVCLASAEQPAAKKRPVPRYTNEDLERVSPLREQTGVLSTPSAAPAAPQREPERRGRGEEYWRREAERLRERLAPLQARARELRDRIEGRRRQPNVRPYTDERILSWQRRLDELQSRIQDLESRFEERARRDGALPGWLR